MKKILLYIPVVLSILVLGAHFLRFGNWIGVFAAFLLIALLFLHRPWVARLMQVVLVLGTLDWLRTAYERMLVILGIVAAVTLCSALLFESKTLRKIYGLNKT